MQRPGDELLSRAAFALNENGLVRRSRSLDEPSNLLHRPGITYQLLGRLGLRQKRTELFVFPPELVVLMGPLDLDLQFGQRKGFGQEIERAELYRLHGRLD